MEKKGEGYKDFLFGERYDHGGRNVVAAMNVDSAVKIFKLQSLWPEKYVWEKHKKGDEEENDAGEYLRDVVEGAKIPIYEYDHGKGKYIKEIDLIDCINVDYSMERDVKYLPVFEIEDGEDGDGEDDKKDLEIYNKITAGVTGKMKAREFMLEAGRMKKELERKISDIENEVEIFEEIIERKKKQLFAMETYLGMYEEVLPLKTGSPAQADEKIAVFQQKCYMDEEIGLVEADGYRFRQGLDKDSIEVFDKWIAKNFKKYLYREKSIMAWEVRRHNVVYSNNRMLSDAENMENHRTYFLMRNGENLYRIYSGVSTPDRMYPSVKEVEDVIQEARKYGRKNGEEEYRDFVEKRIYAFIALQGLIDRTEVYGTNFRGKINLVTPNKEIDKYMDFIRDAEYEYYITDGKPSWNDYIAENRKTIAEGTRVLVNNYNYWNFDYFLEEGDMRDLGRTHKLNGGVFIAEEVRKENHADKLGSIIKYWDEIISALRKMNLKNWKIKDDGFIPVKFENKKQKIEGDLVLTKSEFEDEKGKVTGVVLSYLFRFDLNYHRECDRKLLKETVENGKCNIEAVIAGLKKEKKHIEEDSKRVSNYDEFKLYKKESGTVYSGWNDYEGHERKNRVGHWFERNSLVNIDEIKQEDIKYYLNNRLYRNNYIEMFGFLKYVYMYKKWEHEKETDFVKLVMGKSGCNDEKKVRSLMTWWKIKNKWRRFLSTDENKAYRMIMSKLKEELSA